MFRKDEVKIKRKIFKAIPDMKFINHKRVPFKRKSLLTVDHKYSTEFKITFKKKDKHDEPKN